MTVRIGDKVRLKELLIENKTYGKTSWVKSMRIQNNDLLTVLSVYNDCDLFTVHETKHIYSEEMLNFCLNKTITNGGSTPSQYSLPKDCIDLQDLIEYRNMDFSLGNIFKACYRLGFKNNNKLYELNKIRWFVDRLIELANNESIK